VLDLDHIWKPVCKSRAPARWDGKKMSNAPKGNGSKRQFRPEHGHHPDPTRQRPRAPQPLGSTPDVVRQFCFKLTEAASLSGVPCSDVLEAKPNEGMSTYQNIPRQATNKFFPESSTAFCRSPTHTGPLALPLFSLTDEASAVLCTLAH
jgi:hypothetical protein